MTRLQSRREFMGTLCKGMAGALAGYALADWLFARHVTADADGPNVLFIAIDDLNDWVGCLGGHPDVRTPNLDALASRGVCFTRAYCSAPACNPSRASLLTGIRPSSSGVYHNDQPWRPVMPEAVTLPQHFKAHGYEVRGRGKIFHGRFPDQDASWDEYIAKGRDPLPPNRPLNGIPDAAQFDWGPLDVTDEEMDDTQVANWGVEFLRGQHDRPFFLGCGFFRPHLPWYVPRRYFDMYPVDSVALPNVNENDLDDVPEMGRRMANPGGDWRAQGDHKRVLETNNWRRAVQGYLACVTFVDTQVGKLLDALYSSRYAEDTTIILWGDHGWHLGEKLHWRKFALWEEATHAPLMFVAPGVTPVGQPCHRTVSFLDLYPTLTELCGLPPPENQLEGVTLLPLLSDPSAAWDRPAVTTHGRNNHSVRSEGWRYIRYRDGSEELYDEAEDPLEWTNLAGRPEHAQVKQELAKWLPEVNAEDAPRQER